MNDLAAIQNSQLLDISRRLMRLDGERQQAFLKQLAAKGVNLAMLPIARRERTQAPLSFAQARLWFLWRMEPDSAAYNMPIMVRLRGPLDERAMQQAFDALVVRHEALRTVFRQSDGEAEQIVRTAQPARLRRVTADDEQQALRLAREEAAAPFDLVAGPLLRVAAFAVGETDHILVVTLHHIVADGWSMGVLVEEFWRLYESYVLGSTPELPTPAIQYADYAIWQRLWVGAVDGERQIAYWRRRLEGQAALQLQLDHPRPALPDHAGAAVRIEIEPPLADRLRAVASAQRTTLFVVLLAVFKLLLYRHTGQSDISIGVPVANRHRDETRGMIGLFVNTQVLRSQIDSAASVADLIASVHAVAFEAQEHQDLPFERLMEILRPQRTMSQSALFQVLYNHQRRISASPPNRTGLMLEKLGANVDTVKFDLALDSEEMPTGEISAVFSYATALFEPATVERLAAHWVKLLQAIADDPAQTVAGIALLSVSELAELQRWNGSCAETATFTPVHRAFARWAEETPDASALVFGDDIVSYGELDRRANRLAHRLIRHGVGPGELVGICARRSPSLVVALLAVLKAGAAYLPLDPDHPPRRRADAIGDAGIRLVLADTIDSESADIAWIALEAPDIDQEPATDPAVKVDPQSLAYVITTSGSTGAPKGVAIAHGPFAMHCEVTAALYDMDRHSRELHFLSFTFDGAHERLWTALTCGAALVMRDDELWSAERTLDVLRRQRVSNAGFPPAYLQQLAHFAEWKGDAPPVELYSFGGEAMPKAGFDLVKRALKPRKLINGYGPTETVVTPLVWKVDAGADVRGSYAPIGRPVGRRSAYVLDGDLNMVPSGVTGELYIGGEGLAQGYWRRRALTAERFVPDPFGMPGARLYRTGDLAHWNADGVIEYVGRTDHQVKIRGFRVEPGEIEARLMQQPGVRLAVVAAREAGASRHLVGYVSGGSGLDEAVLRAALSGQLPDYMVPTRIMVLPQLPVTTNGKVDREALPAFDAPIAAAEHVAPRTAEEEALAAIWRDLLGQAAIGVTDNFFELGGDSIISLQMVSRARKAGLSIEPRDVFRHQTLEALARAARRDDATAATPVRDLTGTEHALLPIQLRFFGEDAGERHHWNQAVLLAPRARLDWEVLRHAMVAVVAHHDALRLQFERSETGWRAAYGAVPAASELLWVHADVRDAAEVTALASATQASLSLSGPLLRAVGMDLADGSQRLLVVIHHLVVDGVSWRVLLEDIAAAYAQLAQGLASVVLAPKSQSYASWGERLQAYAGTSELAAQLPYWLDQKSSAELPCDEDHGGIDRVAEGEEVSLLFDAELTAQLLKEAPAAYRTQANDLLLAALLRAIWRWSEADDVLVELEGHGREDIFTGVEIARTVGWFTTAFPVLLQGGSMDDAVLIKSVKEQLRAIPARGLGYGVLRHLGTEAQRNALSAIDEPRIVFNYLGQFDASVGADLAFAVAPESAGASRSPDAPFGRWLNINGQVREGRLQLSFAFGRKRYRRATVERLAGHYADALRELVAHCVSGARGITPSDVELSGLSQGDLDRLGATLDWRAVEDIYPLSSMQQGMLFHALHDGDRGLYVNQLAVEMLNLDATSLRMAWQAVSARHAVLRTGFAWRELSGAAQQIVYRQAVVPFVEEDWSERVGTAGTDLDAALAEVARRERTDGFDLSRPPLQRVRLIRLGEGRQWLIWTHHHILLDGWSSARLIAEVLQHQRGSALPVLHGRYRDYIGWLQQQDREASAAFWRSELAGLDGPSLLADAQESDTGATGHASLDLPLDPQLTAQLQAFARRERVTLNTLLQGAWAQLLRQHGRQRAVCFGATVSGRPAEVPGSDETVGLFINTLPVVDAASPQDRVGPWLRALQQRNVDLRDHGWMPLNEIQRLAGYSGRALFDSILVFENYPVDQVLRAQNADGPRFGRVETISVTNYAMTVAVFVASDRISLGFRYDRSRFDDRKVQDLHRHLSRLLRRMATDAERPLGNLGRIDGAAALQVRTWSGDDAALRGASVPYEGIVARIEAQAARSPSSIALVFSEQRISYGALNARANRLARQLRDHCIGHDVLVGLAFERSADLIVAVLAVLKAGGGYLPLDPDYPAGRLAHMLRDSGATLVLTHAGLLKRLAAVFADASVEAWTVENGESAETEDDSGNLGLFCHADSLAYVMYTSGSTGVPKGVACSHGALAQRLGWMQDEYRLEAGETLLHKTPFSFDVSVWEILWPLSVGARLAIAAPGAHREPRLLIDAITAHDVTTLHFVPQMLEQFVTDPQATRCVTLKRLFSGGEALSTALQARVLGAFPGIRFDNRYGPTEALINATFWTCVHEDTARVPIGRPIPGTIIRILDGNLNLVPAGVTGELFIGGAGLARGYWRRAALTADRFIPDPFGMAGDRLYRTGDLARWRTDGAIDYVGRADHQVKIRGFRIELGEIEAQLLRQPGVRSAAVVAREVGAGRQLTGYVGGDAGLDEASLRASLASALPDYMVPQRIAVLERLPLAPNGKIDRQALPAPDAQHAAGHRAPRSANEMALAEIWAELLGQPAIGVADNFFELGGDSIVSLQMVSRARRAGLLIEPRDVFQHQTLEALALAARTEQGGTTPADQGEIVGSHPLLPIQLRFFAGDAGLRDHWNQAVLLLPRDRLDWDLVTRALATVVDHHDALRLRFVEEDGTWRAEHCAAAPVSELLWLRSAADGDAVTALASLAQASLSLVSGPLLRAVGIELADGSQRLLIVIHHLVVDGISWRILLEDIATAYRQLAQGAAAATLGPKSHAYAAWGARLRSYAASDQLAAELPYWLERNAGDDLPCDDDHGGADRIADAEEVLLLLDAEVTARLLKEAPAAYRTQINDLLLAALARAISRWSGRDDVVVELEGHGREDLFEGLDISRTVGWFTTAFPLRLQGGALDAATLIKRVKEELRGVPARGLGYGVLCYLGSDQQRAALSGAAEPRIVFNYLGQFDGGPGEALPFSLAPESAGASRSASAPLRRWISINGQVRDGQLKLSFGYSGKRFRRATIERLAALYETGLQELIDHCTAGGCGVTPSDFALSGLAQSDLDALGLNWREIADLYPLSPMQQGMLFHALHDSEDGIYVNQVAAEVRGLDAARLRAAWQAVSDRHMVLRTGFIWRELSNAAQQVVYCHAEVPFVEEDWRGRAAELTPPALEATLAETSRRERAEGFDLSRPPLQRVRLIRLADDRHWLIWTHHHILLDGWSSARLIAEVLHYEGGGALPPVQRRYRDYIEWLQKQDRNVSAAFWREALAPLEEPSFLADAAEARADLSGHDALTLVLDAPLTERLRQFAGRERVTLNTLVQGAWAQLLRRQTGQDVVCFGATVSGRPAELADSQEMIGLFINTLPVVDAANPQQAIGEWLRDLQHRNLAVREHGWTPLYEIQRLAGRPGRALFDSILVFENYPVDQALADKGQRFSVGETKITETSNYPMFLSIGVDSQLRVVFNYQRRYFDGLQVERLQAAFAQLLETISRDAERPVGTLATDDPADRALLAQANATFSGEIRPPLVRQIELQAARRPHAIALIFSDEAISYGTLNARANALAHRLRAHGVGPEVLVGIAMARGVEMVVALLAVLKAGGAYLPLDPEYPQARLAHMLRDSGARLVLTQSDLLPRFTAVLAETGAVAWPLDALEEADGAGNPGVTIHPENLAYVIYTSGSTGMPKGVMVRHHALTNFLATMAERPGISNRDRVLGLTSLSFDIAVLELWLPLCVGARVVLADRAAVQDPGRLRTLAVAHGVTMIQATPSTWQMLLDHDGELPSGCRVLCGGEALAPDLAQRLNAMAGEVWNLYGPTETTVWSARHRLDTKHDRPLLGGPIANTTLHVLDNDLNPAPIGVVGELYIGGAGLARGYWHRPTLTAERFIPDPFGPSGSLLYRTGDLTRWLPEGVLDYAGRADHQLKIRGFRIEPGEIEARLLQQPGVKSAVVIAREAGAGRQLVGYVSGAATLDGVALRTALYAVLPDHMVPSLVMVLERLPLTPNGKIDRKALPAPDAVATQHVAPRTPTEAVLAAIWAELLGQPAVGVTDNFFELGGDSIVSLQMIGRARRAGWVIEPRDVFRHQTIETLALVTRPDVPAAQETPTLAPGALSGLSREQFDRLGLDWDRIEDIYPLSPMQQGMLFHSLRDAGSGVYVNQVSVEIRGLDAERLQAAWRDVTARHPMLRTGFLWRELSGSPLQAVYRDAIAPFEQEDWRGQGIGDARIAAALADERAAEFDLSAPPLQKVRLLRLEDDLYRLAWTYHHILMDGWSSARFVGEVLERYYGAAPAPNPTHYRDYIAWLLAQDARAAERFWRDQLAAFDEPTQLADAFGSRRHEASGHGRCYTHLPADATTALKAFARRERITLNTVVQGVWALLLQRYTGQSTVTFGVTVAGRPAGLDGSQQMLGLFINTLPVIEAVPPESRVGDWLRALQDRNAAIRDFEQTPLYDIQGWAGRAGQGLFDSIIVFENYPIERSLEQSGDGSLRFSGLRNVDVTNYPMDLAVLVEDKLQVEYTYLRSHFTAEQAEQIRTQFEHLLAELTQDASAILGGIDPVTALDRDFSERCNRRAEPAVVRPCVHEAISAWAKRLPERTALIIGGRELSYGALERRANRLAHHLMARGLQSEMRVGIVVERTEATMIALLAVLKAGGAYVPLDPDHPPERLSYIMRDAGISFLLSDRLDIAADDGIERIVLADFDFDSGPDHAPQPRLHAENLAYLIYTSGSTGQPKGVAVAHGPLAMHCQVTGALYEIDETSCELHFLSLTFDGAHERWLTVLSHGARLLMRDAELWTPEQTADALHEYGVSHIGLPPAYLQQLADWVEHAGNPPPVKLYSFGGEAMPKASFDKVCRVLKPRILINGYGPTETVVTPLVWKVDGDTDCETPYTPIGLPVGDRRAYILDAALNIIPAGVAGELYIGGYGVARGYHGRAGMTAERFVPDPFAVVPGGRLYRTGDLARWREDGSVEYLGRSDDQVKINGFRIEPGEIEAALRGHPEVDQAAVVAATHASGRQLVAYVSPKMAGRGAEAMALRISNDLKRVLPPYMVPSRIVVLDQLPVLSSGKIDRRALPAPDRPERSFVAPQSPAEIALARLWSEILDVPQVGVTDNFFELGGNSILSLKVVARLRQDKSFGIEIKLREMLQKPTIRELLAEKGSPATAAPTALLPLNAAVGGAQPVFCLHGGFGTVFDYAPLARRLDGQRQVIGLQSRMIADPAWTDRSLAAMAADYAREIQQAQPQGSCSLIGWSLGGLLAALVADELERYGRHVELLAMVDSFVPGERDRQPSAPHWTEELAGLLSGVLPASAMLRIAGQLESARREGMPETPDNIRRLLAAVLDDALPASQRSGLLGADDLASAFSVGRHLQALARGAAMPQRLAVAPLCWWTSRRQSQRSRLEARLPKAIDCGTIGESHFTILKEPDFLDAIIAALDPDTAWSARQPVAESAE